MSLRNRRRCYRGPDGRIAIVSPSWNDRFSPFSAVNAPLRLAYANADEAGRATLRTAHADWLSRFPFDPFTVTEADFYVWAVTRHQPREPWQMSTLYAAGIEVAVGMRVYRAVGDGRSGQTPPAHLAGRASDGGLEWDYIVEWTDLGDCDRADLPMDREFRDQWRHDGAAVKVDAALETQERWRRIRVERDRRLAASDGPMARANETGAKAAEWKAYRQSLRDVPLQADPKAIVWPVPPA